jgi:hypothetical protein
MNDNFFFFFFEDGGDINDGNSCLFDQCMFNLPDMYYGCDSPCVISYDKTECLLKCPTGYNI